MTVNRSLLATALALSLAAADSAKSALGNIVNVVTPRVFGRRAKKAVKSTKGSIYRPHQSHRECARRRGGAAWQAFKRADRARRGLPAEG